MSIPTTTIIGKIPFQTWARGAPLLWLFYAAVAVGDPLEAGDKTRTRLAVSNVVETFTYEVDVQIRYDVLAGGVVFPDTMVWGMPVDVDLPSGRLELDIDNVGNVVGSSPTHQISGLGMLLGERQYTVHNADFELIGGSWSPPVGRSATIVGGTVALWDTFIGDFSGLSSITGFIEDGNSGDFFNLSNGLGADGKFEFTTTGPDGMSMTFTAKNYGGLGTGWYIIGVDTGNMIYTLGTDSANVDITGVVAYDVWFDASARSFFIQPQTLLEGFPALWSDQGRQIDTFSGVIDSAGNFSGTAHFAGIEFTSLTVTTTTGAFEDGNSAGFDVTNGLVRGDSCTMVMTDSTGMFDLVISGTLILCNTDEECNDGIPCTNDFCDAASECQNVPDDALCNDTNACTSDTCDLINGCVNTPIEPVVECDDFDECTTDTCDPATGCVNTPINPAVDCDDTNACTTDTCDPATGCVNTQIDPAVDCDDTNACTTDTCDPATGCTNTPINPTVDCDDTNACTTDTCDPATGCVNTPINPTVDCDDTNACTTDTCDPIAGCVNTPINPAVDCDDTDVCTTDTCDPATGCTNTPINPTVDCDDTNACTTDTCDPATGCVNTPIDPAVECDDVDECTTDTCDPITGCANTPINPTVDCDDTDACTTDTCDPATGCVNTPINPTIDCDDTNVCTTDTCDPATGCVNTQIDPAVDCDDTIPCTADTCDPVAGCRNLPDDALCDDGFSCTDDSCNSVAGCEHEPVVNCDIPTVSDWGVVVLTLLLLAAGTVILQNGTGCRSGGDSA